MDGGQVMYKGNFGAEWTEPEMKFLAANFEAMTLSQIARALGRTPASVETRRRKMGLSSMPKNPQRTVAAPNRPVGFTLEQIEWAIDNPDSPEAGLILVMARDPAAKRRRF